MNKSSHTYTVSGKDIEVVTCSGGHEARTVGIDASYRIRLAPGSQTPFAGRYHPSMALAEPVIPEAIFVAMLDAVDQYAKSV